MPIQPGAVVKCNQTQDQLWVVKRHQPDQRWRLVSKIKRRGIPFYTERVVGAGHLILIADAPAYEVGATVSHNAQAHTVAADNGDTVKLNVPSSRYRTRGGDYLHIANGNTTTITKAELVLAALG